MKFLTILLIFLTINNPLINIPTDTTINSGNIQHIDICVDNDNIKELLETNIMKMKEGISFKRYRGSIINLVREIELFTTWAKSLTKDYNQIMKKHTY